MQMVSLKFGMFRELAKTTEEQAKKDLHRIRSKHLCKLFSESACTCRYKNDVPRYYIIILFLTFYVAASNPETVKALKSIFEGFKTAAQTYAKVIMQ